MSKSILPQSGRKTQAKTRPHVSLKGNKKGPPFKSIFNQYPLSVRRCMAVAEIGIDFYIAALAAFEVAQ
jgi:hypothetical protein